MSRASKQLINDAVEAATQADELCVHALGAVSLDPDTVSTDQARAAQSVAVTDALHEMRDQLPDGLPADEVAAWWAALSREQQQQLMRAVPVELHDLRGIPPEVKDQLTNTGQGFDPLQAVRWAIDNANNQGIDRFDNNCAHFVSETLAAAGLENKIGPTGATSWYRLPGSGLVPPDSTVFGHDLDGPTHSESWYNANAQRNFFLNDGGVSVDVNQARPGDLVYFNHADGAQSGVSHHTGVVTAVLPDDEVLYSQHTPGAVNLGLQDRLPMVEQYEGAQSVTVVRPRRTW